VFGPMARPRLHDPDLVLDTARALILEKGLRAATMEAIAEASGAPIGSIYHQFASRDDLLARLWLRAVRRSQLAFRKAATAGDPVQAAVLAALSIFDFCDRERADARLLASIRRADLLQAELSAELAHELKVLNEPIALTLAELARRLYGRAGRNEIDRVLLAVFDLPYGTARSHVLRGTQIPRQRRLYLQAAVLAVLVDPEQRADQRPRPPALASARSKKTPTSTGSK
jgi:AcrR family transcriptional regulator